MYHCLNRKQEEDARKALLNNPMKMKQLERAVSASTALLPCMSLLGLQYIVHSTLKKLRFVAQT